jgi:phosphohistidine swiveling domain-containing protein
MASAGHEAEDETGGSDMGGGHLAGPIDGWDPLHGWSPADRHWSRANIAEAMPGVPTPLSWTLWEHAGEFGTRASAHAIGALSSAERTVPARPEDRVIRIFYGRPAMQVEFFVLMGDRMPATSGEQVARGLLGGVAEGMVYAPTRRRYPIIAVQLPRLLRNVPHRLEAMTAEFDPWYPQAVSAAGDLDEPESLALLATAASMFGRALNLQSYVVLAVVQPMFDALDRLVRRAGVGDIALLSGSGGAEMLGMVTDIWKASRGQLELGRLAQNHGFHGPLEGELSSRVWREDPSPLEKLVADYARLGDESDPFALEGSRQEQRRVMVTEVLSAIRPAERPLARLLLSAAARRIPLRGVAKRHFLQGLDVARAAARQVGEHLATTGRLAEPEDVFFLTLDELLEGLPRDARDLVELRRARRADYEQLDVPSEWKGMPAVSVNDPNSGLGQGPRVDAVVGVGVSSGVAEGRVRVLLTPDFADIEPNEILVAPTTDPSWSSAMYISAALVVDIGGALSHAAVVARELGLPCVVNTRLGTAQLRTGDLVRVNGDDGSVRVLEHAP